MPPATSRANRLCIAMTQHDPDDGHGRSPTAATRRTLEIITAFAFMLLGSLVMWDSHRIGAGWTEEGPQSGYFPFYIGLLMNIASLINLLKALRANREIPFVSRAEIRLVLAIFVPSLVYVGFMQWIGLYVASAVFIAVFMRCGCVVARQYRPDVRRHPAGRPDRRAARPGRRQRRGDPAAADLQHEPDHRHHHAVVHLLGCTVRRGDHLDPVQHPGRTLVGGHHLRRLSDGAAGSRRPSADRRIHLVVHRRIGRGADDHVYSRRWWRSSRSSSGRRNSSPCSC
jgi:putative tricarboxylic transport membrane protein